MPDVRTAGTRGARWQLQTRNQPTTSAPGMTSPSLRLVVPYFGARPSYFPLVVRSMAANPDVSGLLLT